jgi:hypothetical protein
MTVLSFMEIDRNWAQLHHKLSTFIDYTYLFFFCVVLDSWIHY